MLQVSSPTTRETVPDLATVRAVAARYADQVRVHFGPRLHRVCLFGSAARGDWQLRSDIDVLVLLDKLEDADEQWLATAAVRTGMMQNGLLLQPLYMTASAYADLLRRERRFALDVETEGIDL